MNGICFTNIWHNCQVPDSVLGSRETKSVLDQLSKDGKFDRYTVTIAAAKGARMVTEEYVAERERAEQV